MYVDRNIWPFAPSLEPLIANEHRIAIENKRRNGELQKASNSDDEHGIAVEKMGNNGERGITMESK
jgi:hypothetical protein